MPEYKLISRNPYYSGNFRAIKLISFLYPLCAALLITLPIFVAAIMAAITESPDYPGESLPTILIFTSLASIPVLIAIIILYVLTQLSLAVFSIEHSLRILRTTFPQTPQTKPADEPWRKTYR